MKILKTVLLVSFLSLSIVSWADSSCVTNIDIPGSDNTCQNSLDFNDHIDGNPFLVNDPNGLCGIGLSMAGLPNISFNGIHVNFDLNQFLCKFIRGPVLKNVFDL